MKHAERKLKLANNVAGRVDRIYTQEEDTMKSVHVDAGAARFVLGFLQIQSLQERIEKHKYAFYDGHLGGLVVNAGGYALGIIALSGDRPLESFAIPLRSFDKRGGEMFEADPTELETVFGNSCVCGGLRNWRGFAKAAECFDASHTFDACKLHGILGAFEDMRNGDKKGGRREVDLANGEGSQMIITSTYREAFAVLMPCLRDDMTGTRANMVRRGGQ